MLQYSLAVTLETPLPQVHDNYESAFCVYRFAYSSHFMYVELYYVIFLCDFFHVA